MNRESEGGSSGIPHLAKNERDVGHPSLCEGTRAYQAEYPSFPSIDCATYLVPDIGATNPENHIPGDVGGVVGNALQSARDDDRIQCLQAYVRLLLHDFHEFAARNTVHLIDLIVHD